MAGSVEEIQKAKKLYMFIGLLLFIFTAITVMVATIEWLDFGEHGFDAVDAVIIGISSDGKESHQKFKQKYNLTYTLLSDTQKEARKLFGVPTSLLGLIPGRVTYVFDKEGNCVKVFNSQTKPAKHHHP